MNRMSSALLAVALCAQAVQATPIAHLTIHDPFLGGSAPIDYDITYTVDNSYTFSANVYDQGGLAFPVSFVGINGIANPPRDDLFLNVSTRRLGVPLAVGIYPNAIFNPPVGSNLPGLDIGFAGRDVSQSLSGSFAINAIDFSGSPGAFTLHSIDVSFEQHNSIGTSLYGRYTYLQEVPEPSSLALVAIGGLALVAVARRRMR